MPDNNTTPPTKQPAAPTAPADSASPAPKTPAKPDDTIVDPTIPPELPPEDKASTPESVRSDVIEKISDSHNVLIALSSDPSVDEMAAAIGLSLYLDKLGKRATAIYSGATPNALEFLKPEETFESTADTLQDFVIAINKDKADHLRYKLDGDFVKIFVTPYKTRISEEDLDFSYGDFNVDLVLALDVANGIDLDSALREHGRIMHDAVIINITTGKPGKFGEIEWSDKTASSVSEMISSLLYSIRSETKIEKDEATAFLTGIVAATNRFSNATTTPETMKVASKLMESGANQQLVSKNITSDVENESPLFSMDKKSKNKEENPTELEIEHGSDEELAEPESESKPESESEPKSSSSQQPAVAISEETNKNETTPPADNSLLDDLKAAEASLANAGAETTPESNQAPLKIESEPTPANTETAPAKSPDLTQATEEASPAAEPTPAEPSVPTPEEASQSNAPTTADAEGVFDKPEKVLQPSESLSDDLASGNLETEQSKYGQMLEEALNSANNTPEIPEVPMENPATMSAPSVPENPEINGVPEMNYMPMPGEEVLPPPPAPPIDMPGDALPEAAAQPTPAAPIEPAAPTPATEPVAATTSDPTNAPQADPGAFKIPGM